MTKKGKINQNQLDAEYGMDSRYKTQKQRDQDAVALMQVRLDKMKKLSEAQILQARLMQLKLQMENYLKEPMYDKQNQFLHFLEAYIDTIYSKRSDFARDINVTANYLSKVMNHHREPQEAFMLKLMIHSEKVFTQVGPFKKTIWYQIYYHEKLCDTMANQKKWRPALEKQVKYRASILS